VSGHFFFERQAGLLYARGHEVGSEGGNLVRDTLGESRGQRARGGHERTSYQRIGVGGKNLVVVVIGIVEEDLCVGDAVFGLDGRVIDLRDAHEKNAVSGANHEGASLAERIGQSGARGEVVGLERDPARRWKQGVREQSSARESLQIPANAEIDGKPVGDAQSVLREGRVFVCVWIRGSSAEALQIVVRHLVGVGA